MGSSQSIPSTSEITDAPFNVSNVKEYTASTKNGPKTKSMDQTIQISVTIEEESIADSDASIVSTESDYSLDEEEEVDEYLAERRMILEEARQLRVVAEYYYHPEAPVASDSAACTRCFFSRYSAPISDADESEVEAERKLILADVKSLKELADWHMHPEKPVVSSDASASGRNYFTRPSAPEHEEDVEKERELILEEMKQLKTTAEWYMHPEKSITVDSASSGRNYFSRPSASVNDEEEERELILEELKQLKTTAEWYMHPEKSIAVDSASSGRNYFSRPSASVNDEEEERELILEELKQLKTTAEWYMHPEKPVAVEATTSGRNYFSRPSAPEFDEDTEERDLILEEMEALKTTADWYMHPEKPVSVDSTACGRNFFSRPSEINDDAGCLSWEDASKGQHLSLDFESNYTKAMEEESKLVLAEAKQLKEMASWYLQPEKPVSVDSTACGRNFFSRPSEINDDAGYLSWEDASKGQHLSLDFESNYTKAMEEESKLVLAEAKQLKEMASWYLQPEKPIAVDSTLFGRNYFSRFSASEQEDEDIEERELILSEVNELRSVAAWYQNPEKEVIVYATAYGRNYFNRPSAPIEEEEDAEEREQILADAAELLRVAQWYMHPEEPVTVYATACGRNFFSRPSAGEDEMEEERLRILEEATQLKEIAGWYANPHQPVKSDGFATGRNFFSRPSAPEYEEDSEEQDQVLAEAKELKEIAGWYANPEQPVKSDGFATARSFFSRPSAPEQEEDTEERNQIFTEANELKEVASWYLQPEKPISVDSAAFGRNYFARPSAEQASEENEEERARILADGTELKKLAVDYLHPEKPVASSSLNCARNYFDRPSAAGHMDHIHTEGYENGARGLHSDYVQHGFDFNHADYDHPDHHNHHDCDISQQSYQSHGDHFDMDEDLHGIRESFTAFRDSVVGMHDPQHIPIIKEEDDGKEGNLSRSPSSIMLFDEQAAV